MKKKNLFLLAAIFALSLVGSCSDDEPEVFGYIDFEEVPLTDGIWNGSDGSGKFVSGIGAFPNSYTQAWDSWMGYGCSSKTDTRTAGLENQYSVIAGTGAGGSKQFAIAFDNEATFTFSSPQNIRSVMVANSTYAYLSMLNGSNFNKKFAADDWFKVTFTGYLNGTEGQHVDYYPADFRDGKSLLSKEWVKVDLSVLGSVDKVSISFDSSDKGQWGMNNPAYICLDNIEYVKQTGK